MNRAERGDFIFSVHLYTLRVRGLASCRRKKAPQGVNLARLVGVAGLNAVVLLDCCTEDFGMVGFQACYKVGHGLVGCGLCSSSKAGTRSSAS